MRTVVDWQQPITVLAIALAGAVVMRAVWRTVFGKGRGCASGCGKCATPAAAAQPGRISLPQI